MMTDSEALVLPDEELNAEREAEVLKWKKQAEERPLKFLVVGRGGTGKSSLVNNLLDLGRDTEESAQEGFSGSATTQVVRSHTGNKYGIQVIAYDTPGFQDFKLLEEDIIAELVDKTDSEVDVCLYCASLEMRISQEDRSLCSLLTKAFQTKLWEKTIFVLTFANTEKVSTRTAYETLVNNFKDNLKECLNTKIPIDKVNDVPFCTAGYADPELPHEDCKHWPDRLYVEIIKRAGPEVTPALLKLRWGPKIIAYAMGGGALAFGGGVLGAGIGAGAGIVGGPIGIGIGAAVGGIIGAVVTGGPVPTAVGIKIILSKELQTIVKAKHKLWKKQQKTEKNKCRLL